MEIKENIEVKKETDFQELIPGICRDSGIILPESIKVETEYHLRNWLNERMIFSYEDYREFLFAKENSDEEIRHMVDIITTIIGLMQ